MKTIIKNASLEVRWAVQAGDFGSTNQARTGLKVRSAVKAGGLDTGNHSRTLADAR